MTLQRLASLRKEVRPIIRTAATSPCLATRQEKSTFSDVAALGNAQNRCAPRYSHRPDKSVFSDTAAFSDAQINRTLLRAQETQALRGVEASRGAQKRDAHSLCKPTLSDVATSKSTQISSSPSHVIEDRAQKPAPSKFINGTV